MQTQPNRNSNSDYKPVSCDLSDRLEELSVHKRPVELNIVYDDGHTDWRFGTIVDLFAKDHADYLKLADGTEVRLDKIIEWRERK